MHTTAKPSASLLTFTLALSAILVAACSGAGTTFTGSDDGGGSSDGGTNDSSPGPDGGVGGCPLTAPTLGQACTTPGLSCEFGGTGPHRLCTTQATCLQGSSGAITWNVTPPSADCLSSPDKNPGACPKDFAALPTGSACPKQSLSCVYDQGMCGCIPCMGEAGVGSQMEWACDPFPQPQGCPVPRPLIGSACTQEGQSCGYGELCGVVSGPSLACRNGRWESQPIAAACAIRQCGK